MDTVVTAVRNLFATVTGIKPRFRVHGGSSAENLALQNNLDALIFQQVFNSQIFDVQSLLQFQQLHTLLAISQTGLLGGLDLASLQLGILDLGLINNIAGVNLAPFINAANVAQIQVIAQEGKSSHTNAPASENIS